MRRTLRSNVLVTLVCLTNVIHTSVTITFNTSRLSPPMEMLVGFLWFFWDLFWGPKEKIVSHVFYVCFCEDVCTRACDMCTFVCLYSIYIYIYMLYMLYMIYIYIYVCYICSICASYLCNTQIVTVAFNTSKLNPPIQTLSVF